MIKPTTTNVALLVPTLIFWIGSVEPSIQPDFIEPIKNITSKLGTNVEFSCAVAHLGSYRIMWLKKDSHKETFVAVNQLKISKNPRISISMLQISDEVTQSTIYVRNIELEDHASYQCAINTNPMISRTGTLEIPKLPEDEISQKTNEPHLEMGTRDDEDNFSKLVNSDDGGNDVTDAEFFNGTFPEEGDEALFNQSNSNNGSVLVVESGCEEMKSYWEDATDSIKEMLKNVFNSLVNFTCSFLTPGQ